MRAWLVRVGSCYVVVVPLFSLSLSQDGCSIYIIRRLNIKHVYICDDCHSPSHFFVFWSRNRSRGRSAFISRNDFFFLWWWCVVLLLSVNVIFCLSFKLIVKRTNTGRIYYLWWSTLRASYVQRRVVLSCSCCSIYED